MQARPPPVREGDVVDGSFPVHPSRPDPSRRLVLRVLGQAEPHAVVEFRGAVHIGGEQVRMVDAQRLDAAVQVVALVHRLKPVHPRVELKGHSRRVADPQNPPHERPFNPLRRKPEVVEVGLRLVEIRFVENLEPECPHRRRRFRERYRVVAAFLHAPQIRPAGFLGGDDQSQRADVELQRSLQIGDAVLDMAEPDDVERRVKDRPEAGRALRSGHAPSFGIGCPPRARPMCFCSM